MKKKVLFCLVFLLGVASMAHSAEYTGRDLLADCNMTIKALSHKKMSSEEKTKAASTMKYIQGVIDGQTVVVFSNNLKNPYCLPDNFTMDQAARLLAQHLNNQPLQLRYPAASSINNALSNAFPCK